MTLLVGAKRAIMRSTIVAPETEINAGDGKIVVVSLENIRDLSLTAGDTKITVENT